ncbi:hypothetical protein NQ318_015050 [Aromia moschata]|uniref:Codanin-1 C-terminal domain-containing protein n=1 Tax=Aromia moschata TaxID=1265417 RepID=A0AAV8YZU6_9CUCU|nr:hypothetical protein NQ318_015050 [Aromia moschata]
MHFELFEDEVRDFTNSLDFFGSKTNNCTFQRIEFQEGLSESQLPFLSSLANVDADKLSRLRSRLVTKQASSGVNRLPAFTGHQEFYRDFIIVAGSYAFNRHLCDALITEIVELNSAGFCCTNLDDSDDVDPSIQKEYVACLRSLRVLAKFLGFVEALPYKSEGSSYAEGLLNAHVNIRKQTVPSFDIKQLLQDSIKSKNLTLSIPWMTEYIAMLDYVTLRLPYYLSVHKILFELYIKCDTHNTQYNYAKCSVKFCLGWLFELPHFPDAEYFNFCTAPLPRRETEDGNDGKPEGNDAKLKSLDEANVVDQSVLYVCCPFLEEVKRLLSSDALNSSVTVKHITPVTAVQSSREIAKKRLEQQLEEAFLNGQPVSVRKTVEFVSERVASACVKHVCGLVPSFKKTSLEEFRKFLASWKETSANASPGREKSQKVALKTKAAQSAQRSLGLLREACEKAVAGIVEEKTRDVCRSIAAKMCLDRVRQWMGSHVTATIFAKDLDVEAQRALNFESRPAKEKPQSKLPPGGGGEDHNESALSAFHLMERIKVTSVDVLENSTDISEEAVLDLLQRSYETLNERCDVNEFVATCICASLVDLSLLLVARRPKLTCSPEISSRFAEVWASRGRENQGSVQESLLSA